MAVKIEARILIFPGTDFHFPSTSVPPGTFLGSASAGWQVTLCDSTWHVSSRSGVATLRTAIHLLLTQSIATIRSPLWV